MTYRLALVALAITLAHCAKKENGAENTTENAVEGDDALKSHLGCTSTTEWDKCAAYSGSLACRDNGCNFSNSQCLPDSGSCGSYASQSECDATPGCEFFQVTNAACVVKCSLLSDDQGRCESESGCIWDNQDGCISDVHASCSSHETADDCSADASCASRKQCVRTDACLELTTEEDCIGLSHCAWTAATGGGFCSDKCLQLGWEACAADASCTSVGYFCEDTTSFECSEMSEDECEAGTSCKLIDECIRNYQTTRRCGQLTADECAARSDCTLSGWCTSSCYGKRTQNNCESTSEAACGWQEIHYRAGPGYRCTTACHRATQTTGQE